MKTKEVFDLLLEKLVSTGISKELAEEYVWFVRRWNRNDLRLGRIKPEAFLPQDECIQTVTEAQRIIASLSMNKVHPREFSVVELHRYLATPAARWKKAKAFIAEFYCQNNTAVDSLYDSSECWLLKESSDLMDVSLFLNSICLGDSNLAWGIFQRAGLLGCEETQKRINTLFELLGPENTFRLIRFDLQRNNWLFYQYNRADPVGCIAYLQQCGLSPEQIFALLEENDYILHLFNRLSSDSRVDEIIARFVHEWEQTHGPYTKNLSLEEMEFLMHGPSKFES